MFAGAEIAVLSIRKTRLAELVRQRARGARSVHQLRAEPERFLATVQVGITVVSATASAFGGARLASRIAPAFERIPAIAAYADGIALALVVVLVAFLSLVLGELVPKSLALRRGEAYALLLGRPLLSLSWLARPIVWLLTAASNLVLRLFGDRTSFSEARLSKEELQQMVDEAATSGSVDAGASEIASRALEFDELDASDVMVPRARIRSLPIRVETDHLYKIAQDGAHARMPVYDGDRDNIIGLVNMREALAAAPRGSGTLELRPLIHPIPFVSGWMSAPDVLRTLQRQRAHMAIIVDEHGSVEGLVTMEDLLEELVGQILSEDETPEEVFRRESETAVVVEGGAPVHEVNRALEIELPEGETFSTVAGLCIHLAGRIPAPGEVFPVAPGLTIEVLEASPRRVRRVRIVSHPLPEEGEDAAAMSAAEPETSK